MQRTDDDDDRRNRFLPDAGNGTHNGASQRAASQPPHHSTQPFLSSPPTSHLVPSSLGHGPWGGLLSSSTRSSSFSSSRFASTIEDDELVDPDDELYDVRYSSPYRGRSTLAPDMSRSRSHSLATAPVGSGRGGGGYNPNAGIGSAANSYSNSYLYGNNAHGGHMYAANRYGSLGGGSPLAQSVLRGAHDRDRDRDETNMSPFVRDVGTIVLDDGSSFRELWERERGPGVRDFPGSYAGKGGAEYEPDTGPGSGTTSRRHSVSGVQPRRLAGFTAPESNPAAGGGTGLGFSSSARAAGAGRGGLLLSDDDLEDTLGSLSLGGGASLSSSSRYFDSSGPGPGSLPIYAPQAIGRGPSLGTGDRVGAAGPGKDWADSYFSPPRGTLGGGGGGGSSVGGGASARGVDAYPQYEGGGGYRARATSTSSNAPLSPTAGGAGRGFATGGYQRGEPEHRHAQQQGYAQGPQQYAQPDLSKGPLADLGKGLPLHAVPPDWPLYIVEFKAGRTDLFYRASDRERAMGQKIGTAAPQRDTDADAIRVGDLVIVEADRGKDLGKVVNDSITIGEVEAYWAGQMRFGANGQSPPTSPGGASEGGGGKKEIAPKMIYGKAGASDAQLLVAKMQDELKALTLCQTKVRAKKLPMEVVDAEYQWDRRKLTFYFIAEKRIDFRELVRELFRLYKTRIWMASLQGAGSYDQ
ncbi:PSP1 C-terminal conserved region-domain-containing protein [Mycena pura]|uniref:PSP1 C-terminal conserved region-domain-containing protein n=1 Tax=Mycena pura TaxID=153505 RepID=A0AAD7E1H2_9AGAR|nr:PSP1 C-terminal conserved region-domain-containing protein [Mycena pura]